MKAKDMFYAAAWLIFILAVVMAFRFEDNNLVGYGLLSALILIVLMWGAQFMSPDASWANPIAITLAVLAAAPALTMIIPLVVA